MARNIYMDLGISRRDERLPKVEDYLAVSFSENEATCRARLPTNQPDKLSRIEGRQKSLLLRRHTSMVKLRGAML
jgi:hypothetical protein